MLGNTMAALADGKATAQALTRTFERNWTSGAFVHSAIGFAELDRPATAAHLVGAAQTMAPLFESPPPSFGWQSREERCREAMGDEGFEDAIAAGRHLDKDAAIDCIRSELDAIEREITG